MNTATPTTACGHALALRWTDGLQGLLVGAALSGLLLALRPQLLHGWEAIMQFWSLRLGLPGLQAQATLAPPSSGLLLGVSAAVLGLYALAGRWPEHLHPLRVLVRALCLVQASACLYFAWAPSRFPYAVDQHLRAVLEMGADMLMAMPLMLTLGWGLLRLPWALRLAGSLSVLLYFLLWVPHQVLLHAWVLGQGTVLFMPLLMLCLGPLLNGWLFVALYGWLLSLTPAPLGAAGARP